MQWTGLDTRHKHRHKRSEAEGSEGQAPEHMAPPNTELFDTLRFGKKRHRLPILLFLSSLSNCLPDCLPTFSSAPRSSQTSFAVRSRPCKAKLDQAKDGGKQRCLTATWFVEKPSTSFKTIFNRTSLQNFKLLSFPSFRSSTSQLYEWLQEPWHRAQRCTRHQSPKPPGELGIGLQRGIA